MTVWRYSVRSRHHKCIIEIVSNNANYGERNTVMEEVEGITISDAIVLLDKLDTQWISGQISEGDRNAQRLVVLLLLVSR